MSDHIEMILRPASGQAFSTERMQAAFNRVKTAAATAGYALSEIDEQTDGPVKAEFRADVSPEVSQDHAVALAKMVVQQDAFRISFSIREHGLFGETIYGCRYAAGRLEFFRQDRTVDPRTFWSEQP